MEMQCKGNVVLPGFKLFAVFFFSSIKQTNPKESRLTGFCASNAERSDFFSNKTCDERTNGTRRSTVSEQKKFGNSGHPKSKSK